MDVIIFFYKKRNIDKPVLSVENRNGYRLVKVGICAGADNWFGQPLPVLQTTGRLLAEQTVFEVSEEKADGGEGGAYRNLCGKMLTELFRRISSHGFFSMRKEKRRRLCEELEQIQRQKQYEEAVCTLEADVRELAQTILRRTEELDDCSCVYTEGVKTLLLGDGLLTELWRKNWNVRQFAEYREYRWARLLLPAVANTHFVILGTALCVPEIVKACAQRMKSLRWILKEKDYGEAEQDFVDEFYEDYGLAVQLQTVVGRNGFCTLCLEAVKPVCILDFTEEAKLFWGGLAAGSVWLDFASLEGKERRLERLAPDISYVSLKKLWNS